MSQIVDEPGAEPEPADAADQRRLGARLHALRDERRWSLTELAEASGVSRAMINRVERGVSSPTATILGRLSGAFGLTVSQLLDGSHEAHAHESHAHDEAESADPDDATGVQRAATADHWTDPDTGYRRRPLSSAEFPVDVTEVRLPAGRAVTYPASACAFLRHCIWVVDGELQLVVGGEPVTLAAGDRIELGDPAEVTYRNDGDDACRYVVVVARGARGRE
ncbi:helix-turn-helix transcriptional regulator [Curtobacterium sp. VKM Ac-2865]|uniref:helix-turn-helix domain-containing protein n=1 Tax=Curtobacterium sp. VKM Ac-2865 TaxID=2783817 RepID=UPI00188A067A|nr:XRE family transcriptional regulator [Curtobacterium sp. VKM Ac-2865]MBF4583635.1 helix-turn-helix transcriptional regulator [Curtobacterium sp. VKM Ac-2865]